MYGYTSRKHLHADSYAAPNYERLQIDSNIYTDLSLHYVHLGDINAVL